MGFIESGLNSCCTVFTETMAQFKGDARDAKRARYGARVQEEMKEAFERKVKEMRDETNKSLHNMELGMTLLSIINNNYPCTFF